MSALAFGIVQTPARGAEAAPAAAIPDSAPDESTAARFARQGHKTVKVDNATTETSETVANQNGTFTRTEHSALVRVHGPGGGWVPPDTTLVPSGNALAPKAARVDMTVSAGRANTDNQPLLKLAANGVTTGLDWPGPLPKPVVTGNIATYPEVLPGVDLKVELDAETAHEVVVVKTPEAARNVAKLNLTIPVTGGKLSKDTDGTLHVRDAKGAAVFTAPPATMWDSSGYTPDERDFVVGPDPGGRQAKVGEQLDGNTLTLTPDAGLLGDKNARYPLYIDPEWTPPNCVCTRNHYLVQYGCGKPVTPGFTKWDNDDGLRAGYIVASDATCANHQVTARSFVELSLAGLAGKKIYSAELDLSLVSGTSCDHANELVLANVINGSMSFDHGPGWTRGLAEIKACHGGGLGFDFTNLVTELSGNSAPTLTFGLVSPDENNQNTWKHYSKDVGFSVTYNSVPNQPKHLQIFNGTRGLLCATGPSRPALGPSSTGFTLRANVSDPDGGMLYAGFVVYDGAGQNGDGDEIEVDNVLSDDDETHQNAFVTVPSNLMNKDGHVYTVVAHAWDGREDGPTAACEVELDLTAPNAPQVSSQVYPPGTFGGGPGRPGDFTFTANPATTKVDHYVWRMDNSTAQPLCDPFERGIVHPATPDGSATVAITPLTKGPHVLSVWTCNRAGTPSSSRTDYQFNVKDASKPAAAWQLEGDGRSQTPGLRYVGQGPGGYDEGRIDIGATLSGQAGDYFATENRVFDTGASYTVSGWANLSTLAGSNTVVSQEGSQNSAFALIAEDGHWKFEVTNGDGAAPTVTAAVSTTATATNTWVHLTGVYDNTAKKATLYVNGRAEATVSATDWTSVGPFVIGGAKAGGQRISQFHGDIDEVAVISKALSAAEVSTLYTNGGVPTDALREYKLDGDTTDATGNDNQLLLPQTGVSYGTGYSDSAGQSATDGSVGHSEGKGLVFTGTGMAETRGPVIDTSRSFTVSAWVKLADKDAFYAVAGQSGINQTSFQLRYDKNVDRWIMGVSAADHGDDGYTWAIGKTVPDKGIWTHLTGVYDKTARTVSIYVNGVIDGQVTPPALNTWSAPGGFSVGGVRALGGNAYFFKGTIDQVQVWSRVLPATEVAELANSPVLRANYQLNGNTNDSVSGAAATTAGGVAMVDDVARFDSTATGEITGPRPQDFRGDRSFTVEAWVLHRWTVADAQNATRPDNPTGADIYARAAVSVDAPVYEPFMFGYRGNPDGQGGWHGQWSWTMVRETTGNQQVGGWTVSTPGTADNGVWTHIAGTYDATTGRMCLYATTIDHDLLPSCTDSVKGWNGADELAKLFIGHGKFATDRNAWYGDLRGVRVYSGVLGNLDIKGDVSNDQPPNQQPKDR